jgi:hypothetical protein
VVLVVSVDFGHTAWHEISGLVLTASYFASLCVAA